MPRAYGVTHTGRIRESNEDCFALDEDLQLYVVADGMGGHNAGEVAARLAVDSIVEFIRETSGPRPFGADRPATRPRRSGHSVSTPRFRPAEIAFERPSTTPTPRFSRRR